MGAITLFIILRWIVEGIASTGSCNSFCRFLSLLSPILLQPHRPLSPLPFLFPLFPLFPLFSLPSFSSPVVSLFALFLCWRLIFGWQKMSVVVFLWGWGGGMRFFLKGESVGFLSLMKVSYNNDNNQTIITKRTTDVHNNNQQQSSTTSHTFKQPHITTTSISNYSPTFSTYMLPPTTTNREEKLQKLWNHDFLGEFVWCHSLLGSDLSSCSYFSFFYYLFYYWCWDDLEWC